MSVPGLRREDFPVLERLTYLNTASAGLVPASVVAPTHAFELELAQARTTGMDEDAEMAVLEDTRRGAAALLGASPDTIAITTSSTEALNQVAWWLRPGGGARPAPTDRPGALLRRRCPGSARRQEEGRLAFDPAARRGPEPLGGP